MAGVGDGVALVAGEEKEWWMTDSDRYQGRPRTISCRLPHRASVRPAQAPCAVLLALSHIIPAYLA